MKLRFLGVFCTVLSALAMAGCTSSSSSSSAGSGTVATSLNISGTLGSAGLMSIQSLASGDVNTMSVTLSDLEIYAIAFTSPPVIAQGNLGSDGSFSVDLPGAKGAAVTAIFRNKASLSEVGVIKFVDTTKKDMNGNSSSTSSIVLSDSVSLGSITLAADGTVEVPVAQIASAVGSSDSVSVGTAFDPTGAWTISAYDKTLPSGYATAGNGGAGQGPSVGMGLSLVRYAGKEFTSTANCTVTNGELSGGCASSDGTIGSADRYALSLWGGTYSQSIGACGGHSGFTADESRAFGHINIETSGIPQSLGALDLAHFAFSTGTGFGGDSAPYNEPWMRTGATASKPFDDCRPVLVNTSHKGWACKSEIMTGNWGAPTGSGSFAWNVGIDGSGCLDTTTNKPVNVTNWSNIGNGTCGSPTNVSSTYGTGFASNTCTYTAADHDGNTATPAISFRCTYTGGLFNDNSGVPDITSQPNMTGKFMGPPAHIIDQGDSCAVGGAIPTDAQKLAGYRCYAESMWNGSEPSGGCTREYNFDWQATVPAKFVMSDYRGKPKNAFLTNILQYSTDGQTATLEDERNEKITIPTGNGSSTFCDIAHRTTMSLKSISANKILIDFHEGGRMASTNAACVAAGNAASNDDQNADGHVKDKLSGMKMMFYLNK